MYWFLDKKVGRDVESPMQTETGDAKTDGNGALMRNCPTFFFKDLNQAMLAARE